MLKISVLGLRFGSHRVPADTSTEKVSNKVFVVTDMVMKIFEGIKYPQTTPHYTLKKLGLPIVQNEKKGQRLTTFKRSKLN